jgi:hypothetical protein
MLHNGKTIKNKSHHGKKSQQRGRIQGFRALPSLRRARGEERIKKGAYAGVRGKQKDRETKEWEQNDFRKAQEDDEEGKKMENRKEEGRKEED